MVFFFGVPQGNFLFEKKKETKHLLTEKAGLPFEGNFFFLSLRNQFCGLRKKKLLMFFQEGKKTFTNARNQVFPFILWKYILVWENQKDYTKEFLPVFIYIKGKILTK